MAKIILITGASSGIGKATALKLLERGHTVYGAGRHVKRMDDLEESGGYALQMDVTDEKSVEKAVAQVIKEQGRIDVVFNNAGYGVYGTIEDLPMEDIKGQFDVNVFGQARVLKAVLPHMRRQKSGLIINMSSVVGQVSLAISGWYAATKHAVEAMSDALRQEVKHLGINVIIIEPGAVKTGFDDSAFEVLDRKGYSEEYADIAVNFRRFMTEKYDKCEGPERTADIIVGAIESKNPKTRYKTTGDAKRYILMKKLLPDTMFDSMILDSSKKPSEK